MPIDIKSFVLLICMLCGIAAKAQTVSIQITLRAPNKDSIIGASIQLYSLPDTLLMQERASKASRNIFRVKPNGSYFIKVYALGYDTLKRTIVVATKPVSDTFKLTPGYTNLQTVTVEASKPLMRQDDDKTIIDAEPLANSSTNAYEVLEKVPGAVLDQDGNIYLNSSTPATVYINGVQMRMSADDIASLLKNLPAGSVERIEVIRVPSAKYDAANTGGIVNVVLKKNVKLGTSGSVNLRMDQGVYNSVTGGFSINQSIGKVRTYLAYQYTHRNYFDDIQSTRIISGDTSLSQKSFTKYSPITNYIGGGLSADLTKKFSLSYDIRVTATKNSSTAATENNVTAGPGDLLQTQSPINSNGNSLVMLNTIFAKYKIDTIGSEWDNEFDYTYSKNNSAQQYSIDYLLPTLPLTTGNGTTNANANYINYKSDLSLQFQHKLLLELGIKLSDATDNNAALFYIQQNGLPNSIDTFKTNTFIYKENIASAYTQLSKTISGTTFKAGLRLEYTDITGHQTVPNAAPFSINRTDLFPYFYIRRKLFSVFGYPLVGNVVLRRSITRPGYDQLNPAPQFVDQFTYNLGNPNLKPQFTTNYEVNATFNDFPVFAIGMNNTSDVFSPVTYQNDSSKIAYRTYDNLGQYREFYSRLFGGVPSGHRYFMYVGVQFNYIHYNGQYEGDPLNYSRASWTFFTGHHFKITPTLDFGLNGYMYVNGFRLFNELKTLGQLNTSITKSLMHKKFNIILSGNDIFKTNKSVFTLQQGPVKINGTRIQDTQRVGLTFRYNFGFNRTEEKKPAFTPPPQPETNE